MPPFPYMVSYLLARLGSHETLILAHTVRLRIYKTMESQKVHEQLRVFADFNGSQVRPIAFMRANRRYEVQRVNLVYRKRVGTRFVWCFAVSDEGNNFVLVYDPETLRWTLEEVSSL